MRTLCKIFFLGLFAVLGIAAGLLVFTGFMIVEVEGSTMLPSLEPGDRVVVQKENSLMGAPELNVGDLVIYRAPWYTTDGEHLEKVRRITGLRGSWFRLNCDTDSVRSQEVLAGREDIPGKVILVIPRLEIF